MINIVQIVTSSRSQAPKDAKYMRCLLVFTLLLAASAPLRAEEYPINEGWAGEIVGQAAADNYAVAEAPRAKENGEVREMRKLLTPNWPVDSSESGESSHPRSVTRKFLREDEKQELRTDLKTGATTADLESIEVNRANKGDLLR